MTLYQGKRVRITWEAKLADMWIGLFWRHHPPYSSTTYDAGRWDQVELWICLVPCLPIHILWFYGYLGDPPTGPTPDAGREG